MPDAATVLRKVSALRALCLRLPHIPTPLELQRLRRFESIASAASTTGETDRDAVATGWRSWWRDGRADLIAIMSALLPPAFVASDRRLAALSLAGHTTRWRQVQLDVWTCVACQGDARVETNLRQQTELVPRPARLLVVSLAPPFTRVTSRTRAASATSDSSDTLRGFLEDVLRINWDEATNRGVALLHAVKCAIVPAAGGFQNPPPRVVDRCAPRHLRHEIMILAPSVVVTLGRMAYRAFVLAVAPTLEARRAAALRLSVPPVASEAAHQGHTVDLAGRRFALFTGPFIRGRGRGGAAAAVERAATAAGVIASGRAYHSRAHTG